MPYLWAAYRKGSFDIVHPVFKEHLTKDEFLNALVGFMDDNTLAAFIFMAEVSGKLQPIGLGLFWERGRILQTENLIWFPWSTKRSILESYVSFIANFRKEIHEGSGKNYVILEFAMEKDQKYFDHVCRYGVMRRVGTSLEVYPDAKSCIYESRSLLNA